MIDSIGTVVSGVSTSSFSFSGGNRNGNVAGDYVFSRLAEAEQASRNAAAQSPGSEPVSMISVRLGDRVFDIAGEVLDVSTLKAMPIAEMPEEDYQSLLEGLERWRDSFSMKLENMTWPEMPDASTYAVLKDYASIMVGGEVVAKTDNQGGIVTYDNALSQMVAESLAGIDELAGSMGISYGPDLAQFRAERIAGMLGGTVTKLSTALTQGQYDAAPKLNPENHRPRVNDETLKNDPEYIRIRQQVEDLKAARAVYLAGQGVG